MGKIADIFDDGASSDDWSYLLDYRDFQFSQIVTKVKYVQSETSLKANKYKKRLNATREKKCLLFDSGSTFSCCNDPKMLINIRDCKKPIDSVSDGGVLTTSK